MTGTMTPAPVDAPPTWQRSRSALLALLSIELVVLVATGIALYFVYRPTATQAWADLYQQSESELSPEVLWSNRLRLAHRLAGYAAIPTGLVAGIALVLGDRPPLTVPRGVAHAALTGLIAPIATYTGFLLPWDQLALWAVTAGTNVNGFGILFEDQVRFVIIHGVEVEPGTILAWLGVHVALGAVLVVIVAAAWRRLRGTQRLPDHERGAVTS